MTLVFKQFYFPQKGSASTCLSASRSKLSSHVWQYNSTFSTSLLLRSQKAYNEGKERKIRPGCPERELAGGCSDKDGKTTKNTGLSSSVNEAWEWVHIVTAVREVTVMSKCQGDRLPCPGFTRFPLHTWQTLGCKPILSQPWLKHMAYNSWPAPRHHHSCCTKAITTPGPAQQHSQIDSRNLLSLFLTFQIAACVHAHSWISWPGFDPQHTCGAQAN